MFKYILLSISETERERGGGGRDCEGGKEGGRYRGWMERGTQYYRPSDLWWARVIVP